MQQLHHADNPGVKVILVGTGRIVESLIDLCRNPSSSAVFSVVGRVGGAGAPVSIASCPLLDSVPEYPDIAAAVAAHPEADMICDLTDDGSGMQQAALASSTMILAPGTAIQRFCENAAQERDALSGEFSQIFFSSLIDQFEEDLIIVDVEGRVVTLNERLLELWGGSKHDYVGKKCDELDKQELACVNNQMFFETVIESGRKVSETYTDVTKDGRIHYFHVNALPLRDARGAIRYVALSRRDTTAQVQMEQRLYQSQKMAAIGELSTYIAHEIRNPLFAIGGFANALLRMGNLEGAAREKARIILEESQRLDDILKNIINFARPTEQTLGDVDVNAVAAQTVEIMSIGTERDVPIRLELAHNIPKVYGNAEMLKQCLINLIKNAQEAMTGGGTIKVRTRYVDTLVYLEVEDDGPGIPTELQEQIFSPFFSTKDKGSGLGLAMTRKIINEIGGQLLLHSRVGHGTIISMALKPALAVAPTSPMSAEEQ